MYSTKYVKARDVSIAASIVTDAEDGKFLAGGMTLIPTMKQRLASPDCLVDLAGCGLTHVHFEVSGDELLRFSGKKVGRVTVQKNDVPGEYN